MHFSAPSANSLVRNASTRDFASSAASKEAASRTVETVKKFLQFMSAILGEFLMMQLYKMNE